MKLKNPPKKKFTTPLINIEEPELEIDDDSDRETTETITEAAALEHLMKLAAHQKEEQFSDLFSVQTKDFDNALVKEVLLPKFVMSGRKVEENGNLFLVFESNNFLYAKLLKLLSADSMSKLKINLLDQSGNIESTITFPKPTLSAIDFGTLAREREEESELKIEVSFDTWTIDEESFSF